MTARVSIRRQLSFSFALLAVSVAALLGWYLQHALNQHFSRASTATLAGKLELMRHLIGEFSTPAELQSSISRFQDALLGHKYIHVSISSLGGDFIYQFNSQSIPPNAARTVLDPFDEPRGAAAWQADGDVPYRVVAGKAPLKSGEPLLVAIGLNVSESEALLSLFARSLFAALFVTAAVSACMGTILVRRALRPLHEISDAASAISALCLDRRLDQSSMPEELAPLALAFNRMVGRLQVSIERLSQFSSDLAHEMRTPLHAMLVQCQVILSRSRSTAEYRIAVESTVERLERLARMTSDMLFLAKTENSAWIARLETFHLMEEVSRMCEFYEPVVAEEGVRIQSEGDALVLADRQLVQRAIGNLISNAIRHGEHSSPIQIAVHKDAEAVRLTVTNRGPVVAAEHLPHLFERFYRVDAARPSSDGAGLGLAIVKTIMQALGGSVRVDTAPDRMAFTLIFPRAQELPLAAPTSAVPSTA